MVQRRCDSGNSQPSLSAVRRDHGGSFHLDSGLGFDEGCDLDHGHSREMPAHQLAVYLAHALQTGEILLAVGYVPGHANDVLGTRTGLRQHREDVLQALANLADEILRPEGRGLVPSYLAGDEDQPPLRDDAVRIASRLRPARWVQPLHPPVQDAPLRASSRSRSTKRCILPVCVFGSSSMNSIARGYL